MVTPVRKFSIALDGHGDKPFPVLYILQDKDGSLHYCVVHPDTGEQLFIEAQGQKVTKIFKDSD